MTEDLVDETLVLPDDVWLDTDDVAWQAIGSEKTKHLTMCSTVFTAMPATVWAELYGDTATLLHRAGRERWKP